MSEAINAGGPVRFLDPFSVPGAAIMPYTARLSRDMKAPVIGLFSNLFVDATVFLEDVGVELAALFPHATFLRYDKGHVRNASIAAPVALIEQIRSECDAVVLAYGHCGSCSGGLVRDTVALAKAGVPLASLVTRKFVDEAHFLARAGGVPDVPFVFLPHPIAGETPEYQRLVANRAAPLIRAAFYEAGESSVTCPKFERAAEAA